MNNNPRAWIKPVRTLLSATAVVASISLLSPLALAQQNTAELYNAFDVTAADAMDKIVEINSDASTAAARDELEKQLTMMANMDMQQMMAAGGSHGGMNMGMNGPFGELEVEARVALGDMLRESYSDSATDAAIDNSDALDEHTAMVIKHGRVFENRLFAIYTDDSIANKQAVVDDAIASYLSDAQHSVPTQPKDSSYLLAHPYANAFKAGFPRISGLLWSNQWMKLATLEAVIQEHLDSQFSGGIEIATERYWNKVGSAGGMTMFPAPTELPMAPAISPNLYSQSQQAAVILDNLNVLKAVIADILAYPNLQDRGAAVNAVVAEYTDKENNLSEPIDYLLFALRGGIYNQGGPAVGALMQSERNRSRSAMDMQHTMIMSSPQ